MGGENLLSKTGGDAAPCRPRPDAPCGHPLRLGVGSLDESRRELAALLHGSGQRTDAPAAMHQIDRAPSEIHGALGRQLVSLHFLGKTIREEDNLDDPSDSGSSQIASFQLDTLAAPKRREFSALNPWDARGW